MSATHEFSLFSTIRFTTPPRIDPCRDFAETAGHSHPASTQHVHFTVEKRHIPLVDRHIARLSAAHAHYVGSEGQAKWGVWPGDDAVYEAVRGVLQSRADAGAGDYRVRVLLHPGGRIEVQTPAAPPNAGPFSLSLPPTSSSPTAQPTISAPRRPLILDSQSTDLSIETPAELDKRRFKTTSRGMYDAAAARAPAQYGAGCEVLLWSDQGLLLETCTSNVALWLPKRHPGPEAEGSTVDQGGGVAADGDEGEWVTPRLSALHANTKSASEHAMAVFLDGVVRQELLARGVINEGEVTVQDFERCRAEGRPVIGFNGLRGVWLADLV